MDPVLEPPSVIREDFDRIAMLSRETCNQNIHYHPFLLRQIPSRCRVALEIGCGKGAFSRLLAERSDRVTAVDLSPEMIRIAKDRSARHANIDYQTADILTWSWPENHFDCIMSIATLHHLPLEQVLLRCASALTTGGTLLVLDLYQAASVADCFWSLSAVPISVVLRMVYTGRLRDPRAVREAWAQHGKHEHYLNLSEIRSVCARILPGARIRRHLLWRYSIVWRKPGKGGEAPV